MAARSVRSIAELTAQSLAPDARAAALERVAEHYALAITPAMAVGPWDLQSGRHRYPPANGSE